MKTPARLFMATRPQFLPAVAVAVGLGASVAWRESGSFNAFTFSVSMVAALLYHAGMNVLNDYYDFKNGTDSINKSALSPFTGGSRFIQTGLMTPSGTFALGAALIAAGSIAGIYLALTTSPLLFAIGFLGLLSGYFYSAPPVFLVGRGLGEITVGVTFGLLTVLGAYLVQTGTISLFPVFASLPLSFLIAGLLYVNEFPDFEADRSAGKRTLVVRLGPERARYGLIFILILTYSSLVAGVILGFLPKASLIVVLTAFISIPGALCLIRNYNGGPALIPAIKAVILTHLATGLIQIIADLI
ncbi:MAG TPA: hypothetical protein DDW94_04475 [Deltaproteobacteria bacterium]|nr:MAG: hypothetical protein A2Z79_12930 [Deltaproteobacteria bacterium GWA2_55_82]OGQ62783.1 MAG: hypothetical protein A3I81_11705 [Deltaproteobacteria bacterium RIFCSPLOWO2_02_FULL_55_12]OIJ73501.1 MAG: hypothetical protein A2V21_304000 [Deltaproteobacteria bacterium GWC2_55_46]HBG46229.1 hypothetical protein [Deltaproteobacteria bacterium]HCY10136.1 hypothetical protein [Deltaproteobacteria bacterium]